MSEFAKLPKNVPQERSLAGSPSSPPSAARLWLVCFFFPIKSVFQTSYPTISDAHGQSQKTLAKITKKVVLLFPNIVSFAVDEADSETTSSKEVRGQAGEVDIDAGDFLLLLCTCGARAEWNVCMAIEVDPEALWEDFRDSPTSRLLGPSPIVQSAIARNMYLFQPPTRVASVQQNHKPFDRMLAVHIRRGDYVQHCHNLAAYGASYYSWAQLPELVDKFTPGQPEEEMMRHCLPTPAQLVQRIEHVRSEYGKVLDVLYLLTNSADEDGAWLDEVKRSLRGWHTLVTTRELILDAEQTEVGMAVDMQLAREAAVFLGNGWSSFTSNIIHQRLVDGRVPLATRLT